MKRRPARLACLLACGAIFLPAGCGRSRESDPSRLRAEALLRQLRNGQLEERKAAAEELAKLRFAGAVEPLIRSLAEPQPAVRQAAVFALGEIGDRRAVPALLRALEGGDGESRKLAADALGKIGDERAVEPLLERLGDSETAVRLAAGAACGRFGARTVEPLIGLLKTPDAVRRAAAAFALGRVQDAHAVDALLTALSDESCSVRIAAADSLGALGGDRAAVPLAALLREPLHASERERFERRMAAPIPDDRAREIVESLIGQEGRRHVRRPTGIERIQRKARSADQPTEADRELDRLRETAAEPLTPEKRAELEQIVQDRIGPERRAALAAPEREKALRNEQSHLRALLSAPPSDMTMAELDGIIARRLGRRWWDGLSEANRREAIRQEYARPLRDESRCAAAEVRRAAAHALSRIPGEPALRALLDAATSRDRDLSAAGEEALQALPDSRGSLLRAAALNRAWPAGVRLRALEAAVARKAEVLSDALTDLLRDSEPAVRRAAAEAFRALGGGSDEAVSILTKALSDPDRGVRLAAAEALGTLGRDGAAGPLQDLLDRERRNPEPDGAVLSACCRSLGQLHARTAVDALIPLLAGDSGDPKVPELAATAARALGRIGDARAVEPLIALLAKRNYQTMFSAAEALGEIADPRAIDVLHDSAQGSDGSLSLIAIAALGRINSPRATDLLIGLLRNPRPDKRKKAAEALISQGERAVPRLVETLADGDRDCRGLAAQALGYAGKPAVEPLLEVLKTPPRPESVPLAMYALSMIGDERARPALLARLHDPVPGIRANAAWALGSFGDGETLAALKTALRDGDEGVRKSAQAALDRVRSGGTASGTNAPAAGTEPGVESERRR